MDVDGVAEHSLSPLGSELSADSLRSAALLLSSLGYYGPASRITNAVDRVLLEGKHMTPDLGGRSTTTDVTEAVLKLI
jgi:homoisocitrate dehydrogenase